MRVRLDRDERTLLFVLLRGPVAGVSLQRLPGRVGWSVERVADVLAALIAGSWVEVVATRVRVNAWAAAWLDHQESENGQRWRSVEETGRHRSLEFEPADERGAYEHAFVLTGADVVWREIHRHNCTCDACRQGKGPSGTRPRPERCDTCKGRPLPPLWECLRCGRGGRDRQRPPLPAIRPAAPRKVDDGLKGGIG